MRAANKRVATPEPQSRETGRRPNAAKRARRLMQNKADSMPVVEAPDLPRSVRQVDAELVAPAPRGGILEVLQQPYLLKLIVQRELAAMYAASLLGLLWSYVQPALRFLVYYLVMGFILRQHATTPYFAIHLFCGIVFVHYFGETWAGGTRSIWNNRALVKKMRMPREIFPVASMVVAAYHTLPQMLVLVIGCLIAGWSVSFTSAAAGLLGLLILMTFATGMALVFSALNVFYRDFQNIVGTILQFMHFAVPMMYSYSRVYAVHESHPIIYQLYMANPVAQGVILMQRFFWYPLIEHPHQMKGRQFPPDMFERGLITLVVCIGFLYLAQKFFSKAENKFPERL